MAKSNNKTEMVIQVPSEPKKVNVELTIDGYGASLYLNNKRILTLTLEGQLELIQLSDYRLPLQLDEDGFVEIVKEY